MTANGQSNPIYIWYRNSQASWLHGRWNYSPRRFRPNGQWRNCTLIFWKQGMNLLLDTHILLWVAGQPDRLSEECREMLLNPANTLIFSAASLWEITIKTGIGRSDFNVDPIRLRKMLLLNTYRELPISSEHATALIALPLLHKDPFDRMLITQARIEGLILITSDAKVAAYGEGIQQVWVDHLKIFDKSGPLSYIFSAQHQARHQSSSLLLARPSHAEKEFFWWVGKL